MADVLDKMNEEKRLRLINSAMKEFGANRFDKASTNVIVKEAGISKGLLYHYFQTKEALYDYLLVFTLKSMSNAIVENVQWDHGDLVDRMLQVIQIKLGILKQFPYMMDFGKIMHETKSVEEIKEIVNRYVPDLYNKVYSHNIDYTVFKDTFDVTRVVRMIQLFLEGYSEEILHKYKTRSMTTKDLEEEMDELTTYLTMYKKAFYKSDNL